MLVWEDLRVKTQYRYHVTIYALEEPINTGGPSMSSHIFAEGCGKMGENVFLLVHHRGKIDENTSEGVTFSSKKQIGVFINPSTSLDDLQNSIIQKLGKCSKRLVKQMFFRIPILLRQAYVKFGKYEMLGDDDIRVIFHSQSRFPDLGAMELFVKMADVEGSSGGSAPNPPIVRVDGASSAVPNRHNVTAHVSSPSFAAEMAVHAEDGDCLGDVRTLREVAAAMREGPVLDGATTFMEVRDRDPVAEAIGDDDSDSEPPVIGDESDDEDDTRPVARSQGQTSSQTQQYPPHFSTLDLETMNQPAFPGRQMSGIHRDEHGMHGAEEFEVGHRFQSKEEVVLMVKNYNIRRGVQYKVFESDQLKSLDAIAQQRH
ncbi:uncharacterized protein LOC107466888 [Arachis duranensis]|uniref:Uncharacterized protein LOC107466888 n=2 Tax=Arachis TaxID=3817 RepID=A0A6P4BQ77_ARADU|nr:uncharacterized protein LOC107466888 [Arachis duranensis]